VFTSRVNHDDLLTQVANTRPWIRRCDAAFSALVLLSAGLGVGRTNSVTLMVIIIVAAVLLVASFIIEPATTTAAMREHPSSERALR
jgi:hypothetical protein